MEQAGTPIRVVVADDSAVMRRLVAECLRATGMVEVVAEAADGAEAIDRCAELAPDVLTLDLSMPNTNGLDVLERLHRERSPVRVVVVSAFAPSLVERALDVLEAGASDLVAKPKVGDGFDAFSQDVAQTVLAVARGTSPASRAGRIMVPRARAIEVDPGRVLVIASSTGGPRALGEVVPILAPPVGSGAVLVQHMPEGFTGPLSRRLDRASRLSVREAVDGDRLDPRTLLVAPAGRHLRFDAGCARLDAADPVGGLRPRADLTIGDVARDFGPRTVLLVLTGMGSDGLAGARDVHDAGGIVLAQDESDCVVYGMPRCVIEADLADAVGTLPELPVLVERALATPLPAR